MLLINFCIACLSDVYKDHTVMNHINAQYVQFLYWMMKLCCMRSTLEREEIEERIEGIIKSTYS